MFFQKRSQDESSLDPVSNADDETQRSVRKSAVQYNKADITTSKNYLYDRYYV